MPVGDLHKVQYQCIDSILDYCTVGCRVFSVFWPWGFKLELYFSRPGRLFSEQARTT